MLLNDVPVEVLWDEASADAATFRNLLQRKGYADLDAVRAEGRDEGREEGRRSMAKETLRELLARREIALSAADEARIAACSSVETLRRWIDRAIDGQTADQIWARPDTAGEHDSLSCSNPASWLEKRGLFARRRRMIQ